MKTVLVANRKGGCGKTLSAITIAGAAAAGGARVALADADPQKSAQRWIKRRPEAAAAVRPLDWSGGVGDVPKKIDWLVIDAPGALAGTAAEELISEAKAVLTPVMPSIFDVDSTKRFLKDIDDIKRVRKGKVMVHVLANGVQARATRAQARLDAFFEKLGQAPLAWIGTRSIYGALAEEGLSVFDRPNRTTTAARTQWFPVLEALGLPQPT